jgi:DNA mismatch repair protein MutS
VVARAETVLRALEEGREGHKPLAKLDDLPLFAVTPAKPAPRANPLDQALRDVQPDGLTPKGALDLIYRLKSLLDDEGT